MCGKGRNEGKEMKGKTGRGREVGRGQKRGIRREE